MYLACPLNLDIDFKLAMFLIVNIDRYLRKSLIVNLTISNIKTRDYN